MLTEACYFMYGGIKTRDIVNLLLQIQITTHVGDFGEKT